MRERKLMNKINTLLRRTRLALLEFGPSMAVLMLPGGYLIALAGLIDRHWPVNSATQR
jgi:hypothetical protein